MSSRREFLKVCAAVSALPVLGALTNNDAQAQATPTTALDEKAPNAVALGYYEDHTKVDLVKWPKKGGPEGAKQICGNCQLLLKKGLTATGKSGEYGVCALFPTSMIAINGWCNSWVQKVGA